jgi:hypothetical protein
MDSTTVKLVIADYLVIINNYSFVSFFFSVGVIGALFYPVSRYFQNIYLPLSTLCHSMIHIVANIANFILYSDTNIDINTDTDTKIDTDTTI